MKNRIKESDMLVNTLLFLTYLPAALVIIQVGNTVVSRRRSSFLHITSMYLSLAPSCTLQEVVVASCVLLTGEGFP